ncbi:sulfurtransferase TusA family protein [Streptomyces sp. NPDC044780]|uniref:sulfurtransferase TusA family protein n=1 Tax=unclassified Streptomyces TaxID=2593676 RepID=UPI0033E45D82
MTAVSLPAADITVDGTGLLRVTLLLRLRKRIDGAAPGTVVHVIATDPAAPLDLPAWCHMTGHAYLGPVPGADPVYALQLAVDALPIRADAPWHPVSPWPPAPPSSLVFVLVGRGRVARRAQADTGQDAGTEAVAAQAVEHAGATAVAPRWPTRAGRPCRILVALGSSLVLPSWPVVARNPRDVPALQPAW